MLEQRVELPYLDHATIKHGVYAPSNDPDKLRIGRKSAVR